MLDHGGTTKAFRMRGWARAQKRARGPPTHQKHPTLSEHSRALYGQCWPIAGIARGYLEARGCVVPPALGNLRRHQSLKHASGYVGAALVALVTDAVTRKPLTLRRTWIQADGTMAAVDAPRMLLGGHRKADGDADREAFIVLPDRRGHDLNDMARAV